MSFSDRVAINVPPIFLRLALAITFFWAGAGKLLETASFQGEDAARLANMGVLPQVENATPTEIIPESLPEPSASADPNAFGEPFAFVRTQDTETVTDAATNVATEAGSAIESAAEDTIDAIESTIETTQTYTAADFPEPGNYRRVYGLALVVHKAAFPSPDAEGNVRQPFWPEWAGEGRWPVVLAWAAATTELLGALLLVIGFLTRFTGLALAGTMANAAWLTQIGPALQSGDTVLGFLPNYPTFDVAAWTPLLWQFALFCAGSALLFSGAGALSLDRTGRRASDDEDAEEDDDE